MDLLVTHLDTYSRLGIPKLHHLVAFEAEDEVEEGKQIIQYFIIILNLNTFVYIGILFWKLFWPTVRKNVLVIEKNSCKLKAEGWEFAKSLRSLEQFIQTVWKIRTIFETEYYS